MWLYLVTKSQLLKCGATSRSYDYEDLDKCLNKEFAKNGFQYRSPLEFCPRVGVQTLEIANTVFKKLKIGNGEVAKFERLATVESDYVKMSQS